MTGWADRGPLNQYARTNYRSDASWLAWRNADCSAAALDWLLGAYGQQLGRLDDAIVLLGPGTGYPPAGTSRRSWTCAGTGARGPRTAASHARPAATGLDFRTGGLARSGPLLMDGARWFGEGHWFVAIGYDTRGIYIRDSSGWDTRYLSWSRLYGEVGFSGWVVGVVG